MSNAFSFLVNEVSKTTITHSSCYDPRVMRLWKLRRDDLKGFITPEMKFNILIKSAPSLKMYRNLTSFDTLVTDYKIRLNLFVDHAIVSNFHQRVYTTLFMCDLMMFFYLYREIQIREAYPLSRIDPADGTVIRNYFSFDVERDFDLVSPSFDTRLLFSAISSYRVLLNNFPTS